MLNAGLLAVVVISCGILVLSLKYGSIFADTTGDGDTAQAKHAVLQRDSANTPSAETGTRWPMFRGEPSLRGVASGKLPESLKLHWRFRTDGPIRSSAAVDSGRVYIGSDDGKIYCLGLSSGEEIWSFQTEDSVESSPCLLSSSVFVGSSDAFLYALDAETGDLRWKYQTDDRILGAPNWSLSPESEFLAPPAYAGAHPRGEKAWVLVGSYDNKLHCVDSVTGQAVWTYETESYINGAPAVLGSPSARNKVVFGGCDEITHVVSIAEGIEIAEIETGSYIAGSPALTGRYAYVGNYGGELMAIDISAGEILWRYGDGESPFFSSPAVGETRVVIGCRDERLHCVKRDTGEQLWTFQTRGNVDSSPVICDGKVIVGSDDGRLYIVRLSDGEGLWSYEIGEALTGSPAVASSMVIIGSEDGYVYAFGPESSE